MTGTPNYRVTINGYRSYDADTEAEVWDIVGRQPFGTLFTVSSPKGLDVSDFVPY